MALFLYPDVSLFPSPFTEKNIHPEFFLEVAYTKFDEIPKSCIFLIRKD